MISVKNNYLNFRIPSRITRIETKVFLASAVDYSVFRIPSIITRIEVGHSKKVADDRRTGGLEIKR